MMNYNYSPFSKSTLRKIADGVASMIGIPNPDISIIFAVLFGIVTAVTTFAWNLTASIVSYIAAAFLVTAVIGYTSWQPLIWTAVISASILATALFSMLMFAVLTGNSVKFKFKS